MNVTYIGQVSPVLVWGSVCVHSSLPQKDTVLAQPTLNHIQNPSAIINRLSFTMNTFLLYWVSKKHSLAEAPESGRWNVSGRTGGGGPKPKKTNRWEERRVGKFRGKTGGGGVQTQRNTRRYRLHAKPLKFARASMDQRHTCTHKLLCACTKGTSTAL